MEVELTEVPAALSRSPLYGIRWGAVFAGLVVGVAVYLLLMLIGIAAGSIAFGADERPHAAVRAMVAAWSGISMPIAALLGGYVTARTSGLRRTSDGVLHGLVGWGAAILVFALLGMSALGATLIGMLGLSATSWQSPDAHLLPNRYAVAPALPQRQGPPATPHGWLAPAQGIPEPPPAMERDLPSLPPPDREDERAAQQMLATAGTWLCAAIVVSLLAGMGGGAIGVRGTRRRDLAERHGGQTRHRAALSEPV